MFASVDFLKNLPHPVKVIFSPEFVVFFKDQEDFEVFKRQVQTVHDELYYVTEMLQHVKKFYPSNLPNKNDWVYQEASNPSYYEQDIYIEQIRYLQDRKRTLKWYVESLAEKISVDRCPLKNLLTFMKVSQNKEDIQKAQARLDEYTSTMIEVFTQGKADLSRQDLLEHCIGPKNYLFLYYDYEFHREHTNGYILWDLEEKKDRAKTQEEKDYIQKQIDTLPKYYYSLTNSRVPWKSTGGSVGVMYPVTFAYALDNEGPHDLEDEIRSDLSDQHLSLDNYPRLITEYEITRPIDENILSLGKEVIPIIDSWSSSTDDQKDLVWTMLQKHNQLSVMKELTITFDDQQDATVKKGHVQIGQRKKPFTMKVNDLILRIPHNPRQTRAGLSTTQATLQSMEGEYKFLLEKAEYAKKGTVLCGRDWGLD
jgi:hypothetical protein